MANNDPNGRQAGANFGRAYAIDNDPAQNKPRPDPDPNPTWPNLPKWKDLVRQMTRGERQTLSHASNFLTPDYEHRGLRMDKRSKDLLERSTAVGGTITGPAWFDPIRQETLRAEADRTPPVELGWEDLKHTRAALGDKTALTTVDRQLQGAEWNKGFQGWVRSNNPEMNVLDDLGEPWRSQFEALCLGRSAIEFRPVKDPCLHQVIERLIVEADTDEKAEYSMKLVAQLRMSQHFLIRHDWAAALGPAIAEAEANQEGGWWLPADKCIFEFDISGFRFIVSAEVTEDKGKPVIFYVGFVRIARHPDRWLILSDGTEEEWRTSAQQSWLAKTLDQIKAVCIALDAEVAETAIVRTPDKLNQVRAKKGRPPINDYHVVDLIRRRRYEQGPPSGATHASPRFHFRRGHVRRYPNYSIRIRWTFVGDPDLGSIDKHYRL